MYDLSWGCTGCGELITYIKEGDEDAAYDVIDMLCI